MPTKKKRVGFIPRLDVMKIIDKLSKENNLSNSKIISILVEEALSTRGIFNKKTGKVTQSYQSFKEDLEDLSCYSSDLKDNEKFTINPKLDIRKNSAKNPLLKETNQEAYDLQTYKKFLAFLKFQEMMDEYKSKSVD